MSKIVLKKFSIPVMQIVNLRIPKNEKLVFALQYGFVNKKLESPDDYVGKCKLELSIESEKNTDDKTFYSVVEVEGIFHDKSGTSDSDIRKDAIIHNLLPQANAILGTSMSLAKIPPSFIPEDVFVELED